MNDSLVQSVKKNNLVDRAFSTERYNKRWYECCCIFFVVDCAHSWKFHFEAWYLTVMLKYKLQTINKQTVRVCAHRKSPWKNFEPFTADWIVVKSGVAGMTASLLAHAMWKSAWSGTTALLSFRKWHCKLYFWWHPTHAHAYCETLCAFVYFKFFVYPFVYSDFSIWKCLKWVFSSLFSAHLSAAPQSVRAHGL